MKRTIVIREGVDVILDCSRVVERLDSDNILISINTIMVTWFIQRLHADLETLAAEVPLDERITQYVTRLHLIMC